MKLFPLLIFILAANVAYSQQKEFGWLIGTWQEEGKSAYEAWMITGNFLSAEAYYTKDGVKTITEEIRLIKKENEFYYVPDVAGRQGEVEFKITSFDDHSFTAENPLHDFPKKIIYRKTDDKHIKASISDGNKTIDYSLIKIQ